VEKKNRAARAKLKKEDNARIIKFVENALKHDPRINRLKEAEKAAKEAKKKEKEDAARALVEEAERKIEEERLAKEKQEQLEKEQVCIFYKTLFSLVKC
jgi:DnaJ homolog subfamily C member 2